MNKYPMNEQRQVFLLICMSLLFIALASTMNRRVTVSSLPVPQSQGVIMSCGISLIPSLFLVFFLLGRRGFLLYAVTFGCDSLLTGHITLRFLDIKPTLYSQSQLQLLVVCNNFCLLLDLGCQLICNLYHVSSLP